MHIMLATDGSSDSALAVDFLMKFPFPSDRRVTVTQVIADKSLSYLDRSADKDKHLLRSFSKEAESLVGKELERFQAAGWQGTTEVRTGDPAEAICEAVKDLGVDLLVVGSRGLGAIDRFILGSVSEKLVEYAECSVLVAKSAREKKEADSESESNENSAEEQIRVLFAYDGSDQAKTGVASLANMPLKGKASVELITVLPVVTMYAMDVRQHLSESWQEAAKLARADLDEAAGKLKSCTDDVTTCLEEGTSISQLILKEAEKISADLIVVGHRGQNLVDKFLLGSVAKKIVRHSKCPVWVMRN